MPQPGYNNCWAPLPGLPPAGASLVEVYSAFAYEGPRLVPRIKRELAACLARDGFSSVAEAVGADHRAAGGKKA
jgi:dihydroorotate dehydrogenase